MDPKGEISQHAASAMLEDALHQFDNIINSGPGDSGTEFFSDGMQGIAQLLDDLRVTIQAENMNEYDQEKLLSLLPLATLKFYQELFANKSDQPEFLQAKNLKDLEKLRSENESLSLQASVLTDQVELQMEKIEELTEMNEDSKKKLLSTEEMLRKEIQTNTERDRELMALKEQLRLQTKKIENIEGARDAERLSIKSRSQSDIETETVPSTKAMERDDDVIDGSLRSKLKMLEPTATSTPIAVLDEPHQAVVLEGETPKKRPPVEPAAEPFKVSPGKRIISSKETPKSVSQSDNIDKVGVTMDKSPLKTQNTSKSSSSPNLVAAQIETEVTMHKHTLNTRGVHVEDVPFQSRRKHGIKKFFSSFRLRRSHSSTLQEPEVTSNNLGAKTFKNSGVKISSDNSPFKRGGFRATAGPRLGIPKPKTTASNSKPFAQWTAQEIEEWMEELGLEAYLDNCRRWVKSGTTLLQATNQDIERELGIHNPLHKKKLMLSLQAIGDEDEVEGQIIKGGGMDHASVTRWLDDIGLPQYKESFHKARIDCRMLHHLTIADLQRLKITNLLHTLSLRHAIYTLRNLNFDPMQLKRRPVAENEEVHLWTNHRVMEWLRSIDLAEYAPNLRGSGVHGSLMVMESQFTGDVLSTLLHIPSSKSLLRRHLVSKFNEIIPPNYITLKQKEASLNGLNIMAKVKVGRRSLGPLSRLRNLGGVSYREFSNGEYVCPFETKNTENHQSLGLQRRKLQMQESKKSARFDKEDSNGTQDSASDSSSSIDVVELDESATKKIGAFSAEIATLTNKWSED